MGMQAAFWHIWRQTKAAAQMVDGWHVGYDLDVGDERKICAYRK